MATDKGQTASALSAGSNALLRLGATPLTCAQDVLESFGLVAADRSEPEVGAAAGLVLARVRESAAGADELVRATGLSAEELAVAVTELELAGAVIAEGGVYRPAR